MVFAAGCGGGGGGEASGDGTVETPETRPRQAGGPALLEDVTDSWGLRFTHDPGAGGELVFPEMMGGGVAVFDADADGDLDLYFVSGAPDLGQNPTAGIVNRLFLRGDDGRYVDATDGSGLDDTGYGTGVAVGDVDNDGIEDLFLANFGPDRLFRGLGDGSFEEVTARAGIGATGDGATDWSTSAAFCDFDRDGFLDLYVVRYVIYDATVRCTDVAGRREYCGPDSFEDRSDVLLHNSGDGTFRDVTSAAGIDASRGAGLGVVCADFDDDGWLDLYVANDGDPNVMWVNQGDGTFIDDALIMGTSVNAAGLHEAGMGVVAADFDNDDDLDLFVTHLRDETNTFYRNLGSGIGFEDQTTQVGLAAASTPFTGFGTVPVDLDLDGNLDLVIVNGRVKRGPPLTDALGTPWNHYAEPNLVYLNTGSAFERAGDAVGGFTLPVAISRSLATGDLDADGRLDLVVSNIASPAQIFRSVATGSHWLLVDAFDPRLNRRALGARITVTSGGGLQRRTVHGAMSYLSSSDPRAHFGFGAAAGPVSIAVLWPDGLEETFARVAVDQAIVLRRGEGS